MNCSSFVATKNHANWINAHDIAAFNGMIFDNEHGRLDRRISLAHNDVDHQPTMFGRIG